MPTVRPALESDGDALLRIDRATWTPDVSPAPPPPADRPFFGAHTPVADVLVAEDSAGVMGYIQLGQALDVPAHSHVLEVSGLAVDPARKRSGAGRALLAAAVDEARARGARKLSLRVLGPNDAARRLYEGAGFVVEGVLRGEFHLDGRYVDDVLMARDLTA